jgi:hypothetical protein
VGIASNIVFDNNLINLQELAITKLDSYNPTLHPTNNNSGIDNSGLLGFYFGSDAPVNNYDATAPTIEVWVAYSTPVQSLQAPNLYLGGCPKLKASKDYLN